MSLTQIGVLVAGVLEAIVLILLWRWFRDTDELMDAARTKGYEDGYRKGKNDGKFETQRECVRLHGISRSIPGLVLYRASVRLGAIADRLGKV